MSNKKFNVGDKVKYVGKSHNEMPEFYPVVGTIGVIDGIDNQGDCWVQWPKGTTSDNDCWCCYSNDIEKVIEDMTNEEIWKMLEPKMKKNWLVPHWGDKELAYYQSDVINAIAIAYRSGYERAMKGRPFKFGEKKKKQGGHWEPVGPENLPKEGTKVRYSRVDINYDDSYIKLYDTGIIEYRSNIFCKEFGVKLNKERKKGYDWVFFGGSEDALDMWVEDDE